MSGDLNAAVAAADMDDAAYANYIAALNAADADLLRDAKAEIEGLRGALAAIQSEANVFGDGGCACSEVYVQTLDRVWKMAHDALPVVGGPS